MPEVNVPEDLKRPTVELIGNDGNAFYIMAATSKALRRAGNDKSVIDSYIEQATSGNYDYLLHVTNCFADIN